MERPRVVRLLRIAVSATCLIACALLIVLWVRSYFWLDSCQGRLIGDRCLHIQSLEGQLMALVLRDGLGRVREWKTGSVPAKRVDLSKGKHVAIIGSRNRTSVYYLTSVIATLPHWLAIALIGTGAALPWIKWRFSLRTLLIATTLIAVVLGLVVVFGQ